MMGPWPREVSSAARPVVRRCSSLQAWKRATIRGEWLLGHPALPTPGHLPIDAGRDKQWVGTPLHLCWSHWSWSSWTWEADLPISSEAVKRLARCRGEWVCLPCWWCLLFTGIHHSSVGRGRSSDRTRGSWDRRWSPPEVMELDRSSVTSKSCAAKGNSGLQFYTAGCTQRWIMLHLLRSNGRKSHDKFWFCTCWMFWCSCVLTMHT